eukprot:EC720594.1.p2 GENE.EC720594.1~~EC720594.1.p2  ORF type:complete len:59 (+),score=3.72 EC720594.1:36-212(+)
MAVRLTTSAAAVAGAGPVVRARAMGKDELTEYHNSEIREAIRILSILMVSGIYLREGT